MAKPILGLLLILSSLFTAMHATSSHNAHQNQSGPQAQKAGPWFQDVICHGSITKRAAKLQFYVQNFLGGENAAIYEVARASITSNSSTAFGQVRVMDEKLTAEPDFNSEEVGRAQGLVTSSDFKIVAFTMNLNFVFTSGKYNGSTISIAGRNVINDPVRELAIIGGTGKFRRASGYALTNTLSYNPITQYGVIQYTLYVFYVGSNIQLNTKATDI